VRETLPERLSRPAASQMLGGLLFGSPLFFLGLSIVDVPLVQLASNTCRGPRASPSRWGSSCRPGIVLLTLSRRLRTRVARHSPHREPGHLDKDKP